MNKRLGKLIFALLCMPGLLWSGSAFAGTSIRMYEINKKEQQRKIILGDKVEQSGCHNLLWGKDVYRFAQFGYAWCSLHTEEDCTAHSRVPAFWGDGAFKRHKLKEGQQIEKLPPGDKWIVETEGEEIHSWYCEAR